MIDAAAKVPMLAVGPVLTTDLLQEIGFRPAMTDGGPGYRLSSGPLQLSALECFSMEHGNVVLLTGHYWTSRKGGLIEYPLPVKVETRELGLAFLAYALRSNPWGDAEPHWLTEGRQSAHLLPWERRRAAYNARPRCVVSREWLRLALKTLMEGLASEPAASSIAFTFDGSVLTIRCGRALVVLPASGAAWEGLCVQLPTASFVPPTRLMRSEIEICFFAGKLGIDRHRYAGASGSLVREPTAPEHE